MKYGSSHNHRFLNVVWTDFESEDASNPVFLASDPLAQMTIYNQGRLVDDLFLSI